MRQARLSVDHDALAEFGFDVFQDAGILDIENLSCEGPRGVSRIHLEEAPDESRLDANEAIQWWERVADDGSGHNYLIEMDVADQFDEIGLEGDEIPRAERADVDEAGMTFEQAGSHEQLSESIATLEAAGFDVSLHRLQDYRTRESPLDTLTERQREVLETAYKCGYYDVPRSASAAEIADKLDIDDSTVAEHLQRAQKNLLTGLLG